MVQARLILIDAILPFIQSLILLSAILCMIKHFQNKHSNTSITCLKILSLTPLTLTKLAMILKALFFNTSIIPSINSDLYPFIDNHCDIMFIVVSLLFHLMRYSTWIFYLYRIKYYFSNSKTVYLSSTTFWIIIL